MKQELIRLKSKKNEKPEYVAGVTSMYRKYVDLYLRNGRDHFSVSDQDREMLMDLYNRGNSHTGYYLRQNGRDMLALDRPNHAGVAAVRVTAQSGREISGVAMNSAPCTGCSGNCRRKNI